MAALVEKREYDRFEFQKPVQVFPVLPSKSGNILEVENQSLKGRTQNISEGGLSLVTPKGFSENSILKLNFKVEKDQPVEVYGRIVWTRKKHCGVRFVLADQKIHKGIRTILHKKPKSK